MLFFMKDFVMSCKNKEKLMEVANKLMDDRTHLIFLPVYATADFVDIKNDRLEEPLLQLCKVLKISSYCELSVVIDVVSFVDLDAPHSSL
jgi:hypothetical protein